MVTVNSLRITVLRQKSKDNVRKKGFLVKQSQKRPPVLIDQYPENQSVFTNKPIVPGEQSYSETVKNQ